MKKQESTKMRKYIIFTFMLLFSIPAILSQSKPFISMEKADNLVECNVHTLLGTSLFVQDYAKHIPSLAFIEASPGCGVGLGASAQLVFRDFFALGTSLDVLALNNVYSMTLIDIDGNGTQNSVFVSNRAYCANIPIFASIRFNISDNVRWNVDAGCYFSLGFGGYQKADTYTTMLNDLGQMVTKYEKYEWDYYNEEHPLVNGFDDFDFGLMVGSGLRLYDHYNIGLEARFGTKNASTNVGIIRPNVRNHFLAMKIGYQF